MTGRLPIDAPWQFKLITEAKALKPLEPFTSESIVELFVGRRDQPSRPQVGFMLSRDKRVECVREHPRPQQFRWKVE